MCIRDSEGNYLHAYAPDFFKPRHATPWGAAINFEAGNCRTVRDYFVANALYWLCLLYTSRCV